MADNDDGAWFAPNRYGSGRPITWQGWAACIGWGLLILGAALLGPVSWIAAAAIIVAGTAAFLWVVARKSRDVRVAPPKAEE